MTKEIAMYRRKSSENNLPEVNKRAAKKAAVMGNEGRSRKHIIAAAIVFTLAAAGSIYFFSQKGTEASPVAQITAAKASASEVSYPVALFDDGQAHFFEYKTTEGMNIRYFILKSSDGVIRAAFDACDVCWPAGKGYYEDGDYMVCRNCGSRFASVRVNEVKGGCNPAPLRRAMVNDKLVISVDDILGGKPYFNYAKRS
jgi:uncharacterized membrane protein